MKSIILVNIAPTLTLERFILDKCKTSVHFALQVNFFLANYFQLFGNFFIPIIIFYFEFFLNNIQLKVNWLMTAFRGETEEKIRKTENFQSKCEIAVVNGILDQVSSSAFSVDVTHASASELTDSEYYENHPLSFPLPISNDIDIENESLDKLNRCDYFYQVCFFLFLFLSSFLPFRVDSARSSFDFLVFHHWEHQIVILSL